MLVDDYFDIVNKKIHDNVGTTVPLLKKMYIHSGGQRYVVPLKIQKKIKKKIVKYLC